MLNISLFFSENVHTLLTEISVLDEGLHRRGFRCYRKGRKRFQLDFKERGKTKSESRGNYQLDIVSLEAIGSRASSFSI